MERINDAKKSLRNELGMRIKNQIRVVPSLTFFLDDSADYVEKIDKLLKSIK